MSSCKNCGGHFSGAEVLKRKPPVHPWPLTPVGERVLGENAAAGTPGAQCPNCGQRTLRDPGTTG